MIKYIVIVALISIVYEVQAQDPQYSQYYANALYLSPAFAGADQNSRASFSARYQWPGLDASFFSYTASFDHYLPQYKSGIGIIASSDLATAANLKSTSVGFLYSYQIDLTEKLVFKPGIQLSFVNRSIDFSRFTFGSQYNNSGYIGGSNYENLIDENIFYADVAAGGVLLSETIWMGISAHHLNRPNQTFINGESLLPVKLSLFGGINIPLGSPLTKRYLNPLDEKSITPTFMYKMQGKSDQLDIGMYARLNNLVGGFWYRGIPVKLYKPEKTNHDALVFLLGIIQGPFQIGYSFDYTISKLSMASLGSHEISLAYSFKAKTKKRIQKRPVCPKF